MAFDNILRPYGRETSNTSMFGGNTGRQGVFDPDDPRQTQEALARLMELQSTYGDTLRYGYTGQTKVAPGDAQGYSTYQNAITEADNIGRTLQGQDPRGIKQGDPRNIKHEGAPAPQQGVFPGQRNPLQGNQPMQGLNKAMPESHQSFMKRYGRG